ncbi:hypothetical protein Q0T09_23030, partial [Escherichia coli B12:H4]
TQPIRFICQSATGGFIICINNSFKKRQDSIEFIRCYCSRHTVTVYTKRRFQRGVFINGFNTNIMN